MLLCPVEEARASIMVSTPSGPWMDAADPRLRAFPLDLGGREVGSAGVSPQRPDEGRPWVPSITRWVSFAFDRSR